MVDSFDGVLKIVNWNSSFLNFIEFLRFVVVIENQISSAS